MADDDAAVGGAASGAVAVAWPTEVESVAEEVEEPSLFVSWLAVGSAETEISRPRPRLVGFWRIIVALLGSRQCRERTADDIVRGRPADDSMTVSTRRRWIELPSAIARTIPAGGWLPMGLRLSSSLKMTISASHFFFFFVKKPCEPFRRLLQNSKTPKRPHQDLFLKSRLTVVSKM